MFRQYRTLLIGFALCLLIATLAMAFFGWRGATQAIAAIERTQRAHHVVDALLRVRVDTNRLLTDLTVTALADGGGALTEAQAQQRIRTQLRRVRDAIASELALLNTLEAREEEPRALKLLQHVEQAIDAVMQEFEAVGLLLTAGKRQEAAQRIRAAVDKQGDGSGVAIGFRKAIQVAIDEEDREVQEAGEQALNALARWAQQTQVAVVAAVFLTAVALAVLLMRLRRPLERLLAGTSAVARGDITSRVAVEGADEFAHVGRVINGMLDELEASRARLQAAHASLETQVAERTVELSEANAALRELDAARRRLLADISHELRTPLTIIRGEGEVALRGLQMDVSQYRDTLGRIVDQAEHTARLVGDLLFIARTDASELRMSLQPVPIGDLMRRACNEVQTVAIARDVTIEQVCDIPRTIVHGDAGRLRQLLHIVLDNATRYADPHTRVQVRLQAQAGDVVLRISDRGCGIAPDEIPNVFERFYRGANAADRHSQGSGLGLPMAKAIARAHGGTIDLSSTLGEGTTVVITLPALPEVLALEAAASQA